MNRQPPFAIRWDQGAVGPVRLAERGRLGRAFADVAADRHARQRSLVGRMIGRNSFEEAGAEPLDSGDEARRREPLHGIARIIA